MEQRPDRRAAILDAAAACIAELGYQRTTTAAVRDRARVSSGTLFHYFPTKPALLVGVLERDVEQTRERHDGLLALAASDADAALVRWIDALAAEASDPRLAGFAAALGAVPDEPAVTALLHTEAALAHDCLVGLVGAGQEQGCWPREPSAEQQAAWLGVLADGVLARGIEDEAFDVAARRDELELVVRRVLG